MALVGNMIHDAKAGDPSVVNYAMFVAVFGMLSLIYLIAGTINESFSGSPMFMLIADALNTIFFFCGGVALAADLKVHSCGNQDYIHSNGITNGSDDPSKRCHEAQAVTAFLWFGFASFAASMVFSFFGMKGSTTPRPSIIRRGPGKV
ncbi:MAG: hypothetical protein OHK93_000685 [Ramalina farinacea]|uniref:MARVEL domain-containing protein n=1 Tax=Ramalina farinacea TaxID=258253 RepID=A0AA43QFD8_9LECA|nr:hypothetical protein [Ramalina farinacea]